jgi:hypothetical protein
LRVDLDAYSAGQNTPETWEGYVVADAAQGQGTVVFVAGTQFDIAKLHQEQVVLNRGTDMEIKGEKKNIPVAQIRVLTDESTPKEADEIKFSDGSKANKRYKIEMKSAALQQACNSNAGGMNGTIRSITNSGQTVTSPGNGYYDATYNLDFTPGNGNCIIGMKDSALLKDRLIVSNMSMATLDARIAELQSQNITVDLNTISVLYGGLGSKLLLTINGTSKAIPIEPVGVIVLGIDGLRQDVLYPDSLDSVQDGGQYRVDISSLSGLRQVLAGYDQPTEKQQYVMLPKVTAIFPSITFASWASIFTGKMPKETGILGNEFFARDLYDPNAKYNEDIPGLEAFPSGMVTLDADGGSFLPGLTFAFYHAIPAEFINSIITPATLSEKIDASAPTAALNSDLLWSGINTIVNAKYQKSPDTNERCDKSEYECRTVSIFNQYAEGADWWGTASTNYKNVLTALKSLVTWDSASLLDNIARNETVDFITGYFSKTTPDGKRKRFPAVFSTYLPGIDHYAMRTATAWVGMWIS